MDSDERLTALKKAYADMILNTAKEAAAKIMVSDRRAVRFQHELNTTKEQALQMMLHLKQMMDSKVKEAGESYNSQQSEIEELKEQLQEAHQRISEVETACLSQQRKIEELEAQLGEAEDIVTELREELRKERTVLKSAGNSQLHLTSELDTSVRNLPSEEKRSNTSPELPVSSLTTKEPCQKVTETVLPPCPQPEKIASLTIKEPCQKVTETVLPPGPQPEKIASLTTKEPCQKFPDTVLPPGPQTEKIVASDVKSLSVNPSVETKPPERPSVVLINKAPEPFRNRRTQRIRAFEEKLMAGELAFSETAEVVAYQANGREGRKRNSVCKKSPEKRDDVQPQEHSPTDDVTLKSFRKKLRSSRRLSNQGMKRDKKNKNPDICIEEDSACKNAPSDGAPPNCVSEKGTPGKCTEEAPEAVGVESTGDKEKSSSMDKSCVDKPELPICEVGDGKTDKSAETSSLVSKSRGNRVVRLFYSRKRKKLTPSNPNISLEPDISKKEEDEQNSPKRRKEETLSNSNGNTSLVEDVPKEEEVDEEIVMNNSDGNTSLEKDVLGKKAVDGQNSPTVMEKCSEVKESSQDSMHVAVVAHQLISLSEQKW